MKLTDLAPEFVVPGAGADGPPMPVQIARAAQGLAFTCPCGRGHRLLVWFRRSLNGIKETPARAMPEGRWFASGSSFGTLSLVPSIHAGCWVGWIRDGEVRTK